MKASCFLLTLDQPQGPRLCSQHLLAGDLLPTNTVGSLAALVVLSAAARIANELLDEQDRTIARHRGPGASFAANPDNTIGALPGPQEPDAADTARPTGRAQNMANPAR
jgi:hypothetical protein